MATKKTPAADVPKQFTESANAYVDRLMQGHEKFAAAVEAARARNARVADKLVDTLLAGQRDALSLGKTVAAAPTAYGKNMEAVMQSMTAAQERALDFARTLYKEQAEASSEFRGATEEALESARGMVPSFDKLTSMWSPPAR